MGSADHEVMYDRAAGELPGGTEHTEYWENLGDVLNLSKIQSCMNSAHSLEPRDNVLCRRALILAVLHPPLFTLSFHCLP